MASVTSLYTALSGLAANSRRLDVIGNNISNVNTTAFKSSRLELQSQFTTNLSEGAAPTQDVGGTNPGQIGLGVRLSTTTRNFDAGSIAATGDPRDLAIDGPGFFVVDTGVERLYSRNGAFRPDANNELVGINGERLLGFPVDAEFNLIEGDLQPIGVPVGQLTIAERTTRVAIAGNLNASGNVAEGGSLTRLRGTATSGLSLLAGGFATAASPLVGIEDPQLPGSGAPLFTAGQSLTLSAATRGERVLPEATLEIGAGTTVQELLDFLTASLGIHSTGTANPDGTTPGATIDAAGVIGIVGNTGVLNNIEIEAADLRLDNADGSFARLPFVASNTPAAAGESVRTTLIAFDSLGTAVEVEATLTLVGRDNSGTTWRYDLSSEDNGGQGLFLSTGTISFDTLGQPVNPQPIPVSLSRAGTGAETPLAFELIISGPNGRLTALTGSPSEVASVFRDGLAIGTLERFGISGDGLISGSFTNGATRTLGRIPVARFTNTEGLLDVGAGLFREAANSGAATVVRPGEFATGEIVSGALELSNVDLSQEFVNLILTSTGYSASSRVIQTADELVQQLLVLAG